MQISRKRKIIIISAAVVGLITIIILSKAIQKKEGEPVQTGKVERREKLESKVTASGEIRPVKFYDLTAEVAGRVEQIYVTEGDRVKKGQALVRVDPTQISSQVQANEAAVRVTQAETMNQSVAVQQAESSVNQMKAQLSASESELERSKVDLQYAESEYKRYQQLVESGVVNKSQFEQVRSKFEQQRATVKANQSRVDQLKLQVQDSELGVSRARSVLNSSQQRVKQSQAQLSIEADQLKKTTRFSPIDGVVSNLPVKVGQFALANFSTTPLLTVADMSQINAEIKVDETDIADVQIGQKARIKVDALGDIEIEGEVIEKGASAITRSGLTISQTQGTQEAKDFLVKIKLNPTDEVRDKLRPGMSTTSVITTATVENVLSVPLQAIVPREMPSGEGEGDKAAAGGKAKREVEGVFLFKNGRAEFTPIKTGIKGDQEIEVKEGMSQDDEIIIGPYKTLRTLKDKDQVKRETKPAAPEAK
ncbi:MAG TPA: efflux RND transporter periplasmic adaptor subunit [Blastocatellia bacterium]|jgi:HlyD family secretion protein|nr:efflux RND transporter periplasmic adaptor subunit [Blastocatellia bacterium]